MRSRATLQDLYKRIEDGVAEFYTGPGDYQDGIFDLVDYVTPLYTSDLLQLALDYLPFAEAESDTGCSSGVECIQSAVFDHLREYAENCIEDLDSTWDDADTSS